MKHNFNFEFSPNLITVLGEQLIHDKKIALSELVKNSYDADASEVEIEVGNNLISITDDGHGMSLETIRDVWLKPGVSSRIKNIEQGILTPKFNRMPIGEKGIGRLGSHKLGHSIELHTKSINSQEIYLNIDWKKLENSSSINDLPIEVIEHEEDKSIFNNSGTKILITDLKETWKNKDLKQLSDDLTNLISPFDDKLNFNITLQKDGKIFASDLSKQANSIKDNALFTFDVIVKDGFVSKFNYKFIPWLGLEKVNKREISITKNIDLLQKCIGKNNKLLSFDKPLNVYKDLRIGEVNFVGFIYDYDNILWNTQTQLLKSDKSSTKDYMKANGGIRVYRDGFRVFNYGEKGNDILELDLKRVNRPAGKISSNQILAAIQLNRKDSTGLIEKTNREGFINSLPLTALQNMLDEILDIISNFRQEDKGKITRVYLTGAEDRASVENKINKIKESINNSDLEGKEKNKINQNLDSFAKDFVQIKEIFMNAANAGLSLTIIIHELEKIICNLNASIKKNDWDKVPELAKYLQATINAYKDTIKLDKKITSINLSKIIQSAVFNVGARFDFHQIKVIQDLSEDLFIVAKKNLIIGTINNLFDNAIYWLNYQKIEYKKIIIKSYINGSDTHLLIADNGKGFIIDFESAIMPFITGRKDESSMGIGMHLADTIMKAHRGLLVEGNFEDEKLPKEFEHGAIIKLIFKG